MSRKKMKYPNLPEGFGEAIKQARMKLGISQREVAAKMGISNVLLSQLEREDRNPNYETAVRLRDFYILDFELPTPSWDGIDPIERRRRKDPVYNDRFLIEIDGEVIEVLTYRKLGKVQHAHHVIKKEN